MLACCTRICWYMSKLSGCVLCCFLKIGDIFSSVQPLSRVWLFVTPLTAAHQASLSITNSWSLLKLVSIESVMPSNHLILCVTLAWLFNFSDGHLQPGKCRLESCLLCRVVVPANARRALRAVLSNQRRLLWDVNLPPSPKCEVFLLAVGSQDSRPSLTRTSLSVHPVFMAIWSSQQMERKHTVFILKWLNFLYHPPLIQLFVFCVGIVFSLVT